MKKKAKRYQSGGVLRDRFGNPVRSGSGEVVRTSFPENASKYNEQAPDSMIESSDYSGRGARSTESSQRFPVDEAGIESRRQTSDYSSGSSDESPSMAERLSAASSGSNIRRMDGEGPYTSPLKDEEKPKAKPKPRKRVSQKFPVDKSGMKKRSTESMEEFLSNKTKTGSGAYGFKFKSGGKISSASSRADGIAQRGKTRGRVC
jgi:hypothetical protein